MYMTLENTQENLLELEIGVSSIRMLCTDNENKHMHRHTIFSFY